MSKLKSHIQSIFLILLLIQTETKTIKTNITNKSLNKEKPILPKQLRTLQIENKVNIRKTSLIEILKDIFQTGGKTISNAFGYNYSINIKGTKFEIKLEYCLAALALISLLPLSNQRFYHYNSYGMYSSWLDRNIFGEYPYNYHTPRAGDIFGYNNRINIYYQDYPSQILGIKLGTIANTGLLNKLGNQNSGESTSGNNDKITNDPEEGVESNGYIDFGMIVDCKKSIFGGPRTIEIGQSSVYYEPCSKEYIELYLNSFDLTLNREAFLKVPTLYFGNHYLSQFCSLSNEFNIKCEFTKIELIKYQFESYKIYEKIDGCDNFIDTGITLSFVGEPQPKTYVSSYECYSNSSNDYGLQSGCNGLKINFILFFVLSLLFVGI